MTARLAVGALAAVLAACLVSCDSSPEPPSDQSVAAPTGSAPSPTELGPLVVGPEGGAGPGICARFTSDEIAALVGSEVGEGQVAGPLDSACAWDFTTRGIVLVQVMTPDFWSSFEQPDDPGHQSVPGIGKEAFVQPSLVSGWTAAALFDDRLIIADVSGPTAKPELAVRILEGVVPRLSP